MRVLMLTSSYPLHPGDYRGGFVRDMARALLAQGIEVEVAAPRPDGDESWAPEDEPDLPVRWLPAVLPLRARGFHGAGLEANLRRDPLALLTLPSFLGAFAVEASVRSLFCDCIVAHWLVPMGLVGAAISRYSGRPLGVVAHSGPPDPCRVWPADRVVGHVVKSARSTACVSTSVHQQVVRAVAGAVASDRLPVIPLGVDLRAGTASAPSRDRPLRLLFVGRLVGLKGVDILVRASARVPGIDVGILGDGPEMSSLRALAQELGAPVRFLGEADVEASRRAMQAADLLVVPSRRGFLGRQEGLPRVLAEAWSCGLPVVASATGGLTEAIARQGGGLLCLPGDVADLARALRLCRETPALLARLRTEAMAAGSAFSWDALGPRWAAWVRGLAGRA